MTRLKIWVCEDTPEAADLWSHSITSAYSEADVQTLTGRDNFDALLELIHDRRLQWRERNYERGWGQHEVDQADVIVVDYDLLGYSPIAEITGKRLAYLLRCFTQCGFIIVLNEYGDNNFNLHLDSHTSDFADIHIGDKQIGNPGLWQPPFEGYRPWHWPVISDAKEKFDRCVTDVKENLETPILEFLNLECVIDWLPRQAWNYLAMDKEPQKVTFQDIVTLTAGGVDTKDRFSGEVKHEARHMLELEQMARIAAAQVCNLLNLSILPEQSVLIDAPHLASRFPSVVQGQHDNINTWNKICNPIFVDVDELLLDAIRDHRFGQTHWLWRPAWYRPRVERDERISEVQDPWTYRKPDWVFCEDISRFIPTELAQEFRSRVSPPFSKRFVFKQDYQRGTPMDNLAREHVKQIGDGTSQDPSLVNFVPQSALSY